MASRTFPTGATKSAGDKLDYEGFLSPLVLRRYAKYMHKHRVQADGQLRESDNWQLGIPRAQYMKSLWRHFMEAWTIWREMFWPDGSYAHALQEALCAVIFNAMGLLHEMLLGRDVQTEPVPPPEADGGPGAEQPDIKPPKRATWEGWREEKEAESQRREEALQEYLAEGEVREQVGEEYGRLRGELAWPNKGAGGFCWHMGPYGFVCERPVGHVTAQHAAVPGQGLPILWD